MNTKLSGWNDTIVAPVTPSGVGAIGVVRLSGTDAITIANTLFTSKNLQEQPANTLHVGLLRNNDIIIDEVVLSLFKKPASFTGEDVIEISGHGSPYIQQQIVEACLQKGARMAKPGEFTQRAFLNGKLDLTQAEAVADLIASNSEASKKSALHTIRGGFSNDLKQLRTQLLSFSALIELELDFSQEDVEFADRTQLYAFITNAQEATQTLLHSFALGNVIKNGVQIAIVGKPNVGKSTLLNTLLNENRAIVSDIAGTTRDTIEETLNIDGILFRLVDTAGIREHTSDLIESMGIEKSREKMQQADVVLYLFDSTETTAKDLKQEVEALRKSNSKYLLVANKIDRSPEAIKEFASFEHILFISAKEHKQIDTLKDQLVKLVLEGTVQTEGTIITNARHFGALQQVASSLQDIKNGLDQKLPGDLVALDIRRCLYHLGEITGEITNEDQLDFIFSKFCIGK